MAKPVRGSRTRSIRSSDRAHVLPVNPRDISKSDHEIQRLYFGAANIFPIVEGEFVDSLARGIRGFHLANVTSQELDVENPFRYKRIGPENSGVRAYTENLRAALGVVDGQPQHQGNNRGEHPA